MLGGAAGDRLPDGRWHQPRGSRSVHWDGATCRASSPAAVALGAAAVAAAAAAVNAVALGAAAAVALAASAVALVAAASDVPASSTFATGTSSATADMWLLEKEWRGLVRCYRLLRERPRHVLQF